MTVSGVARARALAEFLVATHRLEPPVPIEALLDEVAEVREAPWPHAGVDAIIPSLENQRPTVFFRSSAPALRRRFTLAHEYGHIQMLWHGGTRSCATGVQSTDDVPTNEEQEADLFASALMAPDAWLLSRRQQADGDMNALLAELTTLELSAVASVRALRRVLLAGWVFRLETEMTISSPGTEFGWSTASVGELSDACSSHGLVVLQRKAVRWFRMFDDHRAPEVDTDSRDTTTILLNVLSRHFPTANNTRNMQRINGKVGGALSANTGTQDEIYQTLVYRLEDSDFEELLEDPEFHLYLGRKARDIAAGRTARRRRG